LFESIRKELQSKIFHDALFGDIDSLERVLFVGLLFGWDGSKVRSEYGPEPQKC